MVPLLLHYMPLLKEVVEQDLDIVHQQMDLAEMEDLVVVAHHREAQVPAETQRNHHKTQERVVLIMDSVEETTIEVVLDMRLVVAEVLVKQV